MKARIVARADLQAPMASEDTSSPTVMNATLMAFVQIMTSQSLKLCLADAETVSLNADNTSEELDVHRGQGSGVFCSQPTSPGRVSRLERLCNVVKALFGLQQSSKLWYDHVKGTIAKLGYHPTSENRCTFLKKVNGRYTLSSSLWTIF